MRVAVEPWNEGEIRDLWALGIDPVQRSPDKLVPLVEHFKGGGSVRAASKPNTPVHVSKTLARKIRELARKGRLDWVLKRSQVSKGEHGREGTKQLGAQDDARAVVRQQAWLGHVEKLGNAAKELEGQLHLPAPHDAGSWVPPQGNGYRILALHTGVHHVRVGQSYIWKPETNGPGTLRVGVEGNLYFPCLQDHLDDNNMQSLLVKWKANGAEFLYACRLLVQSIVNECELRLSSMIFIPEEWPQEGIFWNFPRQVYEHVTSLTEGFSGLNGLCYGGDPQELPSRVLGQGTVLALHYANNSIACHRDKVILKEWRKVHGELLAGERFRKEAEALVSEHRALEHVAKDIRKALLVEIERGTFDRGQCHLCP